MLPKAADAYRRQIAQGLDNDPRAAGKARAMLRKLLGTSASSPSSATCGLNMRFNRPHCSRLTKTAFFTPDITPAAAPAMCRGFLFGGYVI